MTYSYKTFMMCVVATSLLGACSSGKDTRHSQYGVASSSGYQHGAAYQNGSDGCNPQPVYGCPYAQSQYAASQYGHSGYSQSGYGQYEAQPTQTYYGYGQGGYANTPNPYGYNPSGYNNGYVPSRSGPQQYHSSGPRYSGRGSTFSQETLNAFEAPVATEIAGVTFELRGRMDSVTEYSLEQNGNLDHRLVGSHIITAEKQLPNRYTIGATFTGRANDIGNGDSDYTPRIRGFVGGSWGTFFGGSVQDLVYSDTRRLRGAGRFVGNGPREETLHGDGSQGRLADWGGGYQGRYGPTTITAVVDEDANYDVGVKFQRPIGNKDYRLTARHNTGSFLAQDGVTEVETKAVTGVAEYVYGSTRYDISGGVEQFETGGDTADRWFTSAGLTTKRGVWSLTAEGLYGQVEGQDETSAFLGVKYDIARGLSATAAVDYQDRSVNVGGTNIVDVKDTRALMGLSYGF